MKKPIVILAALSLLLLCACLGVLCVSTFLTTPTAVTPTRPIVGSPTLTPLPRSRTIYTAKGELIVPGPAYLDGRDLEAQPPLTVNQINLYAQPGPALSEVVCDRPHGHPVEVLAVTEVDPRFWFQVDAGDGCVGWLMDSLIGPTEEPPIGDMSP